MEYAQHGNLHDFLKKCSTNHHLFHPSQSSSTTSSCSSPNYPLMPRHLPLSSQASYSTGHAPLSAQASNTTTHTYLHCSSVQYDSAMSPDGSFTHFEDYTNQVNNLYPMAHNMSPIAHNYINVPARLSSRDIQNFALQIVEGLEHLNTMKVTSVCVGSEVIFIVVDHPL